MRGSEKNGLALLSKYRGVLMGVAALWVLMTHEWQLISPEDSAFHVTEYFIKRIGFCGVDIFFLLSGMGMVFALEKSSLPEFYYRRLRRILLPFLIVAVVMAVVDRWDSGWFFRCISGVAFYTVNIYSILWFVPAIVTFYLFVPLYFALFRRSRNQILFTVGAIALWLFLSMVLRGAIREDLYGFTNRIPVFLTGILCGWQKKHSSPVIGGKTYICFVVVLVLGVYLAWQTNMCGMEILVPVSNCCFPNLAISVSLSILLAKGMDCMAGWRGSRWLANVLIRVLSFYGMMSFEFYCVQEWIAGKILQGLVMRFGNAGADFFLLVVVTVSGCALFFLNKTVLYCLDCIGGKRKKMADGAGEETT